MLMRYFLSLLLLLSLPLMYEEQSSQAAETLDIHYISAEITTTSEDNVVNAEEESELVPAGQAHEEPQKWVNIILAFILLFALAGFIAIGILMKKSER